MRPTGLVVAASAILLQAAAVRANKYNSSAVHVQNKSSDCMLGSTYGNGAIFADCTGCVIELGSCFIYNLPNACSKNIAEVGTACGGCAQEILQCLE